PRVDDAERRVRGERSARRRGNQNPSGLPTTSSDEVSIRNLVVRDLVAPANGHRRELVSARLVDNERDDRGAGRRAARGSGRIAADDQVVAGPEIHACRAAVAQPVRFRDYRSTGYDPGGGEYVQFAIRSRSRPLT